MSKSISQTGVSEILFPSLSKDNIDAVIDYLQPETDLERLLFVEPEFLEGLFWGVPRFGHPEGMVVYHIREVLDNIEKLSVSAKERAQLRLATFAHDTFKIAEHRGKPRDWSRHHAVLARKFMERLTNDGLVLDLIEFHDEIYHIWLDLKVRKEIERGKRRLDTFLGRFSGKALQLYYLFFKCDTQTGDKSLAPVKWFEREIESIQKVDF